MEDLSKKVCDCGAIAKEVIYAEANKRRGWYCASCRVIIKAIGREHITGMEKYGGQQQPDDE